MVPEAATLMFSGGAYFVGLNETQILNFQTQLLCTQMALEDAFTSIARAGSRDAFILSDRGTCDGRAYMSPEMWARMLRENHWDMVTIRDARYELVIHLVTAADGALEYYTLDNNRTRTETAADAIRLDQKTKNAWVGHPHLRIVDNRAGFRQKIDRVNSLISELAGIKLSNRAVRKYLLKGIPNVSRMAGVEEFEVKQAFLNRGTRDDVQESVRMRGRNKNFTFVHKIRGDVSETKRQITNREYTSLLQHMDSARLPVMINRQCFLSGTQYFVLDTIQNLEPKISLLRCHCDEDEQPDLPRWIQVEREVSGEEEYTMYYISKRITPERKRTNEIAIPTADRDYDPNVIAQSL